MEWRNDPEFVRFFEERFPDRNDRAAHMYHLLPDMMYESWSTAIAAERAKLAPVIEAANGALKDANEYGKDMPITMAPAMFRLQEALRNAGRLTEEGKEG